MISRRQFITGSAAIAIASRAGKSHAAEPESILVNDIHSQLNSTRVLKILEPHSLADVQDIVRTAGKNKQAISVAGGRPAMGGSNSAPIPF